jgi:hypothetical protein
VDSEQAGIRSSRHQPKEHRAGSQFRYESRIKSDAAYLANLAERLSGQIGLPLNLAHERVITLAVSARPRPSNLLLRRPRAVMPLDA